MAEFYFLLFLECLSFSYTLALIKFLAPQGHRLVNWTR